MNFRQLDQQERKAVYVAIGVVLVVAATWAGLRLLNQPEEREDRLGGLAQPVVPLKKLSEAATMLPGEAERGHISVAREHGFVGAAMPPKPIVEVLAEMANSRKQPSVGLNDSDLGKRVHPPVIGDKAVSLSNAAPGSATANPLPHAPVTFKVFRDKANYAEFRRSHTSSQLPDADFSKQAVVILVSTSEFPNKIFQAVEAVGRGSAVTVKYRINPYADEPGEDSYSAIVVNSANPSVKLEQIP